LCLSVKYLILANVIIFFFELLFRLQLPLLFGLRPAYFWHGYIWQPVTYLFLHGGIFHLLINMFILWMFGITLESTWGSRRFLTFFFICGIGAGLLNAAVMPGSPVPTIGASGAIYGILMAFGILFPNQYIYIWGIVPVKAKYFVIGIGIIELLAAISTTHSGVAHFAHLGGMLFGLVYMKWHDDWRSFLAEWQEDLKHKQHLKVVWDREREREKLQKEADALLEKIARNGVDSHTADEQERLTEAGRKMSELDNPDI
jgi:membrane associated rhomboid family serine protease